MRGKPVEYKNLTTGEIAPAHRIGTNDEGEVVYQFVEGWEPTVPSVTDEDGNWIEDKKAEPCNSSN